MSEQPADYVIDEDPLMLQAQQTAQETFKYCWRELFWEYKRIVPALDLTYVKVKFEQVLEGDTEPCVEFMWLANIDFDGEKVSGELINEPNYLTYVQQGDYISVGLSQVADWLMGYNGKTYGGFTIQFMRSQMDEAERAEHDQAWGLDFADFNNIQVVLDQDKSPENLAEHPMSINMQESLREYISQHPTALNEKDEEGFTMLMRNSIAGNASIVATLLALGADTQLTNLSGKTAEDYAQLLEWHDVLALLQG